MGGVPFRLMLVTPDGAGNATRGRPLLPLVKEALAGGVDAVQLRGKGLDGLLLFKLARAIGRVTREAGARFIVNDRGDVARVVGADGLHLPQAGYPVEAARVLLRPGVTVGVSTHTLEEARFAWEDGADYLIFGPVFETSSKCGYGPPRGIKALEEVAGAAPVPVLAIGGINRSNAHEVLAAGALGIAVISAIMAEDNVREAARGLRVIIEGSK